MPCSPTSNTPSRQVTSWGSPIMKIKVLNLLKRSTFKAQQIHPSAIKIQKKVNWTSSSTSFKHKRLNREQKDIIRPRFIGNPSTQRPRTMDWITKRKYTLEKEALLGVHSRPKTWKRKAKSCYRQPIFLSWDDQSLRPTATTPLQLKPQIMLGSLYTNFLRQLQKMKPIANPPRRPAHLKRSVTLSSSTFKTAKTQLQQDQHTRKTISKGIRSKSQKYQLRTMKATATAHQIPLQQLDSMVLRFLSLFFIILCSRFFS